MTNKLKVIFVLVFAMAYIVYLAAPIFAFEGFDVVSYPFTVINGTNSVQMFSDEDMPDSSFYSIPNYESTDIGIATGFPVPYYSDGDHYSVFLNFSFSVPYQAYSNNQWVGIYIRPMLSNGYMSTASSGQWLIVNVNSITPGTGYSGGYTDLSSGSFMWQGDTSCSYKMLITCMNDAFVVANQPRIYNVAIVLDLNLTAGNTPASDELRPFSISARYYSGYPSITSGYGLGLYKDFIVRCTDTSMYGAIEDLASVVADLDFSGLSGLADLSTTIENWYSSYTSVSSTIVDRLENIYDDGETDPDITAAVERASEFQSQIEEYNSLQDALIGTLEEYTFPSVSDANIANLIITPLFENEIVLFLVSGVLALLIACAILL